MSSSRSFFPWVFGVVGPDLFSDALVRIKGRKLFAESLQVRGTEVAFSGPSIKLSRSLGGACVVGSTDDPVELAKEGWSR